jgi:hypothetical protein
VTRGRNRFRVVPVSKEPAAIIELIDILLFKASAIYTDSIFLLGNAVGRVRELLVSRNFAPGNAGVPFDMDVICHALAILRSTIATREQGAPPATREPLEAPT